MSPSFAPASAGCFLLPQTRLVVLCLMNLFRISFSEGHSHKFSILFTGESSVLVLGGWFGQEYSTRLAGFAPSKWGVGRIGLIAAAEGSAASFVSVPQRGSVWSLSLLFRGSLDGEGTASMCCWLFPPLCEPGVLLPHRLPLPHSLFLLLLQLQPRVCQTSPAVTSPSVLSIPVWSLLRSGRFLQTYFPVHNFSYQLHQICC